MPRDAQVTLSDFHALQATLLETRKALYDTRERERTATAALERLRASTATFPPPPPRRAASGGKAPAPAPATPPAPTYPDALNPFGDANPFGNATSSAATSDSTTAGAAAVRPPLAAEAREVAVRERCAAARRIRATECRALLRLIFHAWRASHSQTCILKNMRLGLLQARSASGATGGGGAAGSGPPAGWERRADGVAAGAAVSRAQAEAALLRAELAECEASAGRSFQQGAAHGYQLGADHGYMLGSADAAAEAAARAPAAASEFTETVESARDPVLDVKEEGVLFSREALSDWRLF